MAPIALENEDHARDAAFNKTLHGQSAKSRGGFASMLSKGSDSQKAAVDEYFKHWDNKDSKDETLEIREVPATCTFPTRLKPASTNFFPVGPQSRICHPHKTLLQPRHRPLRVRLGFLFPLLQIRVRRAFQTGHRPS